MASGRKASAVAVERRGLYDFDGNVTSVGVGSSGDDGNGGDVKVTTGGAISVSGDYATGIVAQSVGGSDSPAGTVTIEVGADITASGTNNRAILANTEGDSDNGVISITVDEGATVSSGGGDGYDTISFLDGVNCGSLGCNVAHQQRHDREHVGRCKLRRAGR